MQFEFLRASTRKKKMKYIDNQLLSFKRNKNLPITSKFLNYLFNHGLKIKFLNYFNHGLRIFYFYFYFLSRRLSVLYENYDDLMMSIPKIKNFYKFSVILKSLTDNLEPFFYLKLERVEKKYRKKLKKKFTSKIIYIPPKKRVNLAYKALSYYPKLFSQYDIGSRFGEGMFKTYVEQKGSYLYKRQYKRTQRERNVS